jgi:hypothetical protein
MAHLPGSNRCNCPKSLVGESFCDKRRDGIRGRLRVVIQQPNVISAMRKRVADSNIVAAGKTKILPAL